MSQRLLEQIKEQLTTNQLTVATAESCTGGLIAHTLTNISGSSAYFDQGFITYSNNAKSKTLDVSEQLLKKHGAVSAEVAAAMAEGARKKAQTSIGLSTTGIAGPSGGTPLKPVGLVYIGIATATKTEVQKYHFTGNRLENKQSTLNEALRLLFTILTKR